jgi:hypothetical protein
MSTDINALATQTYREMVKAGMHASPVYLAGHSAGYTNPTELIEAAHVAAQTVINDYTTAWEISEEDLQSSAVELIDSLNIKPPKAEPTKSKSATSNTKERRMVVTDLTTAPDTICLIRPDGQYFMGRLSASKRLCFTAKPEMAMPIDIELKRFWQEELKMAGHETLVVWAYGR